VSEDDSGVKTPTREQLGIPRHGESDVLGTRVDINAPISELEVNLEDLLRDEAAAFSFNQGPGKLLVRLIPIPLILLGIVYQLRPTDFAIQIGPGGLSILIVVMLIGQMVWQIPLRRRTMGLLSTLAAYELQALIGTRQGRPMSSLEGHSELLDTLNSLVGQARNRQVMGLLAVFFYLVTLIGSVSITNPYGYRDLATADVFEWDRFTLALSAGMGAGLTLILWGNVMMSRPSEPLISDDLGLLEIFVPTGHPMLLEHPIVEVVRSVLDPILLTHFDDWCDEVRAMVLDGHNPYEEMERLFLLHLLYRRNAINNEVLADELSESFSDVNSILGHPRFPKPVLAGILERAEKLVPALFSLIDRLMHDVSHSLPQLRSRPVLMDAEIDRVITGERANLLILLADSRPIDQRLRIDINAPHMSPENLGLNVLFTAEKSLEWPDEDALDIASKTDVDLAGLVAHILERSKIAWYDLIPEVKGATRVTVSVVDEGGDALGGRVMRILYRKDIGAALKSQAGKMGVLAGAATPLMKAVPGLRAGLGLP